MLVEIIKFIGYASFIVLIAKYILVTTLRKLAENLNLKPKTVGNIAGYATSVPELLTVSVSSMQGLISTSIINILSSNIINLIQYAIAIMINKNKKAFSNQAIKIDLIMVAITIVIPFVLVLKKVEMNLVFVPLFLITYSLFHYLNHHVHERYLQKEDRALEKEIEEEEKREKGNIGKTVVYCIILISTGIALYVIAELLGETLNQLCYQWNMPQIMIGILLGFITSIPELITFFEAQKHYRSKTKEEILGVVEATNNLLTSNLLNLFIIQSVGIIIAETVGTV